MTTRSLLAPALALFALACDATPPPGSAARPIVTTAAYQALPEVTFAPPLAERRATTAPLDPSLAPLLTIEVCAVAAGKCAGAPLEVISGAAGDIVLSGSGEYTASWSTSDSDLAAGPTIRVAVVLDGLSLAWLDLLVTADGKQLRTELTDELIGANGRTVPIHFFVGRTKQIATHAMHAEGLSATEIAQVLVDEFGQSAVQAATLLKNDGFSAIEIGLALKVVFGLAATP